MVGGSGRADGRPPRAARGPRRPGRHAHRTRVGRLGVGAAVAGGPPLLHAPRTRPGARRALRAGARRRRARAAGPDDPRPQGAHHARRVGARPRGQAAGLPALRGRRRALGAARARRLDRPGRRGPDRPLPLLRRGLAARRRGVRLRPDGRRGRGPSRGAGVPPAGLAPPGGCAHRHRRADRRAGALRGPHVLRRARVPRRRLARRRRQRGHGAPRQHLDRGAGRGDATPHAGARPVRRRAVPRMGGPRRPALPAHHRRRPALAPRRGRSPQAGPRALARTRARGPRIGAGGGAAARTGRRACASGARPRPARGGRGRAARRRRRRAARHRPAPRHRIAHRPVGRRPRHPGRGRAAVAGLDRSRHTAGGAPLRPRR